MSSLSPALSCRVPRMACCLHLWRAVHSWRLASVCRRPSWAGIWLARTGLRLARPSLGGASPRPGRSRFERPCPSGPAAAGCWPSTSTLFMAGCAPWLCPWVLTCGPCTARSSVLTPPAPSAALSGIGPVTGGQLTARSACHGHQHPTAGTHATALRRVLTAVASIRVRPRAAASNTWAR